MRKTQQKLLSMLVLCAFLVSNIFILQPTTVWAEDIASNTTTELSEGTYYVPLTISNTKSNYVKNYVVDCNTGKLIVDEKGNKQLEFKVVLQSDWFKPDGSWYWGQRCLSMLKQIKSDTDPTVLKDLLPQNYTTDSAYKLEPTEALQKQYGYEVVKRIAQNRTSQTEQRRVWTVHADVEDLNQPLYFRYEYYSNSKSKTPLADTTYNHIFNLTLGTPTEKAPELLSKTKFRQTKNIADIYFQHACADADSGFATKNVAMLDFICENETVTADDSTKYYYSLDGAEAITEQSAYIDVTGMKVTGTAKPTLALMNSAVLDLGSVEMENGYTTIKNNSVQAVVDIKDKVSVDGGTATLWVKAYREDTGWSDAQSFTFRFTPLGVQKLQEQSKKFTLNATGNLIPYNMTIAAERDTAYQFDAINSKVKEITKSDLQGKNLLLYDVTTNVNGKNQVAAISCSNQNWNTGRASISNWTMPTGFTPGYLSFYRIYDDGKKVEDLTNISNTNNYGGTFINIYLTANMDYLDGRYVFIKKVLPDLKDAIETDMLGNTSPKELSNDAAYNIPVELTDSDDYSVIAAQDAHLSNRDAAGKSVATVMVDAGGNKTMYLQLQPSDGQYVKSVKYLDGTKLKEAAKIENYTVDGESYPKLVVIPISDDAYQTVLFDNTPINLSIYWQEAAKTDAVLQAAAPEISTTTGATNFVNDATATVELATATVGGSIFYTVDGSQPTTAGSLQYSQPFTLNTQNENGETITVKAMTVKEGMADSAVSSLDIVFKKKGDAAETVATPQPKARYDYSDATNGTTAETGMYMLEILCDTDGANIYYTTDGTTPTAESQPYTGKVQVPAMTNGKATTIKAIAVKDGMNNSAIGIQTIQFSTDWWDNMCEGDRYEVGIAMKNYASWNSNGIYQDSMGALGLKGYAYVYVKDGKTYLEMPFQGMDMGQIGICYMTNLWYFENNSQDICNSFRAVGEADYAKNGILEADYSGGSGLSGHRIDGNVTIPLFDDDATRGGHVFAGIESEVDIMGHQRALLLMDYSNIEKAITGNSTQVVENKAATPKIAYTYDKVTDSNTITIAADGADQIYYAIVSDEETVDYNWQAYTGAFTVSNDNPNVITDGVTTKVNIVAYAEQSGKDNSDITMQMVTFAAKADDSIKAGTYKVPVRAQNAYTSEASMANNALDGPALVTVDENGNATMELTFKGVTIGDQYGHLLTLGVYPIGTDVTGIADWNKTATAEILSYKEDTGLNGNVQEFGRVWQLKDRVAGEDTIYIRVDVDAMNGFPQDARLIFDWSNAVLVSGEEEPDTVDKSELNSQIGVAEEQLAGQNYTEASTEALNAVLAVAKTVITDETATQEEVDKQITAVKAATTALLPKEQKAEVAVEKETIADVPVVMTNESGETVYQWENVMANKAQMTVQPNNDGTGALTIHFADAGSTTAGCITWIGNADGTSPSAITYYANGAVETVTLEKVKIGKKIIDITISFKEAVAEAVALLADSDTEPGKIAAKLNMSWQSFYTTVLGETNVYSKVEETQALLQDKVEAAKAKTQPASVSNEQWKAFQDVIAAAEEAAKTEIIKTDQVNNSLNALEAALELVKADQSEEPVVEDKLYAPNIKVSATEASKGENITVEITYPGLLQGVKLYYTLDGTTPNPTLNPDSTMAYTGLFTVTGEGGRSITITARAFYDGMDASSVNTQMVKFTLSSGGGSSIVEEEDSDWYMVDVYLWKAGGDEASMGDVAFENNRQAWVQKNEDGTYKVYVGTNPVAVSGYTSAMQDIVGSGFDITVEQTQSFTTNKKHDGEEHTFDYISLFSFVVDNLDDIYVPVKISVPYTPMDGITVNVGGYIDARLRFDWSSMEATTTRPEANNEQAKGNTDILSEAVDLTDDATGVRLTADEDVLPEGTAMTVDAITSGSSFDTASKALDGIAESFKLYDIKVQAEGEDVEPSTTVKLYLPIPSDYDFSKVAVYRINEDGTKVVVKGTVEEGKYVIETKTFGLYAVALTNTVQQQAVNTTYDEAVAKVVAKYPDINNHWAASSIAFVVNRGLMGSVADGQFGPNLQLTRGMLVTILGRLEGFDAGKYAGQSSFSDVDKDAWYAASVQWAAQQGIVSGIGNGKFAPDQAITREQLAAILANYAAKKNIQLKDGPSIKFADSGKISPWAKNAMDAMVKAGIIRGNADGTLNPQGTATRAEVAAMLQRFIVNYVDAQD